MTSFDGRNLKKPEGLAERYVVLHIVGKGNNIKDIIYLTLNYILSEPMPLKKPIFRSHQPYL